VLYHVTLLNVGVVSLRVVGKLEKMTITVDAQNQLQRQETSTKCTTCNVMRDLRMTIRHLTETLKTISYSPGNLNH
jgi:hypothetical protein